MGYEWQKGIKQYGFREGKKAKFCCKKGVKRKSGQKGYKVSKK